MGARDLVIKKAKLCATDAQAITIGELLDLPNHPNDFQTSQIWENNLRK